MLLSAGPVAAQVPKSVPMGDNSVMSVLGVGNSTCAEFTAGGIVRRMAVEWTAGFVTGLYYASFGDDRRPDPGFKEAAAIEGWMITYCEKNPLNQLVSGAIEFHHEVIDRARRLRVRK